MDHLPLMEGGLDRFQFQNPSLLSRLIGFSGSFWTWGAVILAAVAALGSAVRRTRIVILGRRRKGKSLIPHPSFRFYCSDDDDDESCSSSSSSDDDEEEVEGEGEGEGEEISSSEEDDEQGQNRKSEDRAFWPELGLGGGVVRSWDGIGLGFDRSSVSVLDLSRDEVLISLLAGEGNISAVDFASPAVVVAADWGDAAAVRVWDARGGGHVASAEWRTVVRRRVVGVACGGEGKVYVRDEVGSVAAVDMRGDRRAAPVMMWRDA